MGGKMIYIIKETYEEKVKGVEISCQDIQNLPILSTKKRKTMQQREKFSPSSAVRSQSQ